MSNILYATTWDCPVFIAWFTPEWLHRAIETDEYPLRTMHAELLFRVGRGLSPPSENFASATCYAGSTGWIRPEAAASHMMERRKIGYCWLLLAIGSGSIFKVVDMNFYVTIQNK